MICLQDLTKVLSKSKTSELISMNKLVGIDGEDPEKVEADWLAAIGVTE